MISISKYHIPSIGLILLGILSIVLAIQTFPHPFQQEYSHDITEITESEISDSTDVRMHSQLSPSGQDVFESALQANSTVTIYGVENKPPDFEYGDIIDHTYIKYNEKFYHLVTFDGNGIGLL